MVNGFVHSWAIESWLIIHTLATVQFSKTSRMMMTFLKHMFFFSFFLSKESFWTRKWLLPVEHKRKTMRLFLVLLLNDAIFDNSSSAVSSASRSFQILRRAKKIRVSRNLDGCRRCHSSSRKGCKTILKVEIGLELTNALLGHLSCSTPSTRICRAMQVKIDFISLFNCSDLLEWTDRVSKQVWAI